MSKYDMDKDGKGICPFCEKPLANDADEREWDKRWEACGNDYDNPELNTWADQFCWQGWYAPGECRNRMGFEERLVEVLEQRDALHEALEKVEFIQGGIGDSSWDYCPWCLSYRGKHRPECKRQLALRIIP